VWLEATASTEAAGNARRPGHIDDLEALQRDAGGWRRVVPLLSAAGMSRDPAPSPATNG